MREIVLDTETTGLDPQSGHRVVEVGCVELINHVPSGEEWHTYINPERDMPPEAFEIHGLSDAFLADKPAFAAIAEEFLTFLGEAKLIIHNASFDLRFLNAELAALNRAPIEMSRAIDTVTMARRKFPGSPASLDALCRRFDIDLTQRDKHGALLDAQLLAEVYLELIGGRQPDLVLAGNQPGDTASAPAGAGESIARPPRPHAPSPAEITAHETFVARIEEPIWRRD